jgi:hypothetical protein
MGKTFKDTLHTDSKTYTEIDHFKKEKGKKTLNRRRRRTGYRNECIMELVNCDTPPINKSVNSIPAKKLHHCITKQRKMQGYCPSQPCNFEDIWYKFGSGINEPEIYEKYCKNKHDIENLSQRDKVYLMYDAIVPRKCENMYRNGYFYKVINDMKKQIERRGKIGCYYM